MNTVFALSRIKRAILHRLDLRTALECTRQRQRKIVRFTGVAAIPGNEARYASLAHFRHDIPTLLPGSHFDYLVAQQFLDEAFIAEQRPKVFFSREPVAHHDERTREYLARTEMAPFILSFGEERIERRMFYVALPQDRSRVIHKLRSDLNRQRPGLCCIVNRYKENARLNLLQERIHFVRAMGQDIDIYGRAAAPDANGWLDYPNYRGPSANKLKTLAGYTFNLCFENCEEDGYITEKIIQALLAGCVPLYRGGGRFLEQTIPAACFINCKDQDPVAVYHRIRAMSPDEIFHYRQAGLDFIASSDADRFCWSHWAGLVTSRLLETAGAGPRV